MNILQLMRELWALVSLICGDWFGFGFGFGLVVGLDWRIGSRIGFGLVYLCAFCAVVDRFGW